MKDLRFTKKNHFLFVIGENIKSKLSEQLIKANKIESTLALTKHIVRDVNLRECELTRSLPLYNPTLISCPL